MEKKKALIKNTNSTNLRTAAKTDTKLIFKLNWSQKIELTFERKLGEISIFILTTSHTFHRIMKMKALY